MAKLKEGTTIGGKNVTAHMEDDVSEKEIHGLRATKGVLEFYDGENWLTAGKKFSVSNTVGFTARNLPNHEIELMWGDPPDREVDDKEGETVKLAKWAGTMVRRKIGSYPVDETDGELVIDTTTRNEYKDNGYVDTELLEDTEYFYMAFPYTEEGIHTLDSNNRTSITTIHSLSLYSYGEEFLNSTGGWDVGFSAQQTNFEKKEEHFLIESFDSSSVNTGLSVVTLNKIDLSVYNGFYIEWENTGGNDTDNRSYLVILNERDVNIQTDVNDSVASLEVNSSFPKTEDYLDVSNLNEEYFVGVVARSQGGRATSSIKFYQLRGDL